MATNAPTILDLKTSFLRTQINALSQPLKPSPSWSDSISPEENTLRQRAVDEALHKLNTQLKQHSKLSYGPQAQRHVAEQIDKLYWKAGERGEGVNAGGEVWGERGADYRQDDIIEQLPPSWSQEAEERAPEQAARYAALQTRLVELSEKRRAARERLEQHERLKSLLEPFEQGVQENLVTKNGEVERELERMNMLMIRVQRGLGNLEGSSGAGEEMEIDFDEGEKKVAALLGGSGV